MDLFEGGEDVVFFGQLVRFAVVQHEGIQSFDQAQEVGQGNVEPQVHGIRDDELRPLHLIAVYRELARKTDQPLHLGLTEAGMGIKGLVWSASAMGALLNEGIGDTIRVSLSEDPVVEVKAAFDLLKSLGLRDQGLTLVACPSCGRADIDLIPLAKVAEERLRALPVPMKVAVMGCEVNGPGEAKDADVGIAGGVGKGAIFRKGKIVGTYPEDKLMDGLLAEIDKILIENGKEPYSQKAPKLSHEGQLTPGRSVPAGQRT